MKSPATIVVAYAAIGSGHRIAAEAIAAELSDREGLRVELLDVLAYGRPRVSGNLLTSAFTGSVAGVYDALWSSATMGALARTLSRPLLRLMFSGFERRLAELSPSAVVCTHALAALIAASMVRRDRVSPAVVSVSTDFGVHGFWPRRGVAAFCVADPRSAETLRDRGFEDGVAVVTGVPVRSQFTLEFDRDAARRHFGIPPERRVVLALAGSMMPGPYERFKEALAVSLPALATLPDTTVVIVCGNDEDLAEQLRTRAAGFGTTNVIVLGYVEQMAPLMATADLIIAKPGGAVCAESLAAGVPLVLVGPSAGQERANAEHLVEAGAALFSSDPRTLAEYARKVVSRPGRLKSMRESAVAVARPFAAATVAEKVLELVDRAQERSARGR